MIANAFSYDIVRLINKREMKELGAVYDIEAIYHDGSAGKRIILPNYIASFYQTRWKFWEILKKP
jgi:hypothetical protein